MYKSGCFLQLSYIGIVLDRTMVQRSNLIYLESDVGPLNECSDASLCLSEHERKLYLYKTPLCFSYFHYM